MCQGPGQDYLAQLKYSKEAGMTGAGGASGRVVGDGVRQKTKELYSEMESYGRASGEEKNVTIRLTFNRRILVMESKGRSRETN